MITGSQALYVYCLGMAVGLSIGYFVWGVMK